MGSAWVWSNRRYHLFRHRDCYFVVQTKQGSSMQVTPSPLKTQRASESSGTGGSGFGKRPAQNDDQTNQGKKSTARMSQDALAVRREQEINAVNVVLLEAEQHLALVSKPFFQLSAAIAASGKILAKKLETRLHQKNKEVLLGGDSDPSDVTGMITRMNACFRQVMAVSKLASVVTQTKCESPASELRQAMVECLEACAPIPDSARIELFWREASCALASDLYDKYEQVCKEGCSYCHKDDFSGGEDAFVSAQLSVVSKAITQAMKACGNKKGVLSLEIDTSLVERVYQITTKSQAAMLSHEGVQTSFSKLVKVNSSTSRIDLYKMRFSKM
jgi:hypothetical protein